MAKQNKKFAAQELRLVKSIVSKLISKAPFLEKEREDIEEILLLKLWESKGKYSSDSRASLTSFLYTILKHKAINILRDGTRDKRVIGVFVKSLEEKISHDDERTIGELINEEVSLTTSEDVLEKLIRQQDLNTAIKKLSPFQQDIAQLLGEGFSKTEIAVRLGKPRTTINDEIKRIQKIFRDEGLEEYIS